MLLEHFTGEIVVGLEVYSHRTKRVGYIAALHSCTDSDCQAVDIVYHNGERESQYPQGLLRAGSQIAVTRQLKVIGAEELERLTANAELVARQAQIVAARKEKAFASAIVALKADPLYAALARVTDYPGDNAELVAENIRTLLKPYGQFTVRTGNEAISVLWEDGAAKAEVDQVISVFRAEATDSPFTALFGGVASVQCQRSLSDKALTQALASFSKKQNLPAGLLSVTNHEESHQFLSCHKELSAYLAAYDCRPDHREQEPVQLYTPEHPERFSYRTATHTKTHAVLHTVKLVERVEREEFQSLYRLAKYFHGYYSRFVHAFIFPSKDAAQQFMTL